MKRRQTAYWAIGCWLLLTLVAFGLEQLFSSPKRQEFNRSIVDQAIQQELIAESEVQAVLTRQQLMDMWLPLSANFTLVPALMTPVRDRSPLRSTGRIDRGEESGLTTGLGIVSSSGVVGRIIAVGQGWSRIQLADDPSFVIPCVDEQGHRGIIGGASYSGEGRIKFRLSHLELSLNEILTTDGSGGVFPANVYLGIVAENRTPVKESRILFPQNLGTEKEVVIFVPIEPRVGR